MTLSSVAHPARRPAGVRFPFTAGSFATAGASVQAGREVAA
jgi:hypothetical protein